MPSFQRSSRHLQYCRKYDNNVRHPDNMVVSLTFRSVVITMLSMLRLIKTDHFFFIRNPESHGLL